MNSKFQFLFAACNEITQITGIKFVVSILVETGVKDNPMEFFTVDGYRCKEKVFTSCGKNATKANIAECVSELYNEYV
jgi:hypothetical protein